MEMIDEFFEVKVAIKVPFIGVQRLCDSLGLVGILSHLFHFLHQQLVITWILDIASGPREDLRRVALNESTKEFGKHFHAVGVHQL